MNKTSNITGVAGTSKSLELTGYELGAGQGLDGDFETGQNGVDLGQKVAVGHQLVLGNAGEFTEHLLIFRMGANEVEENLGRNIAVSVGLFPGLADDAAVVRA